MYITNANDIKIKTVTLEYTSDIYTDKRPSLVLMVNGVEVAYFDDDGLNLLPDVPKEIGLPIDKQGYLKIIRS